MLHNWKALQAIRRLQNSVNPDLQSRMRDYLRKFEAAHEKVYMYGASLRKEGHNVLPADKVDQFINNKILDALMGLDGYIKVGCESYTRELIALIVEDDRNAYRESARAGFRSNCPEADVRSRIATIMEDLASEMCPETSDVQKRREQVYNNR